MRAVNRKAVAIFIIMILLTACGGGDVTDHNEAIGDISLSSVHSDTLLVAVRSEEVTDDRSSDNHSSDNGIRSAVITRLTRQDIIDTAYELYGVSEEWTMWLIGTTYREEYWDDRYLEYAWACEILNEYADRSVWELDCIWGSYYSIGNAFEGFYATDQTTLEMVWEAMTDRDTRIVEVDGMIDYYVPGYYLIYDSEIYNCQVWGR